MGNASERGIKMAVQSISREARRHTNALGEGLTYGAITGIALVAAYGIANQLNLPNNEIPQRILGASVLIFSARTVAQLRR